MVYTQQHTQLIQARYVDPNPREIFVTNMIQQIHQWQQQHFEILLCMDANKNMAHLSPTQGIGHLLHDTGLTDLHKYWLPNHPTGVLLLQLTPASDPHYSHKP